MAYFKFEFSFGNGKKNKANASSEYVKDGWNFVNEEVEKLRKEKRFKTASNYLTAARSWTKFASSEKWSFAQMTSSKMEQYQRWLSERGICLNTISAYMRSLRVLYNRATAMNTDHLQQTSVTKSAFDKVFTSRAKARKRSISEEEIQQLNRLSLPEHSGLSLARDIFMFSFYAMGMPFVDVAYLKKNQVSEHTIHYARHKTGQAIEVAILPPMRKIMEKYNHSDSEYVFPILSAKHRPESVSSQELSEAIHHQYLNSLRRYNYSLHHLSEKMGLPHPLSSYVVRHSWASIAYLHHVDVELIGKALGHTKSSTTLLYIKNLFDSDLAKTNLALMSELGL